MCEMYAELDERVARYEKVARLITDQCVLSSIAMMIERCETQKRELHLKYRPRHNLLAGSVVLYRR